jgi:hypothetical protein
MITDNVTGLGKITFGEETVTYQMGLTNHCKDYRIKENIKDGKYWGSLKQRRMNIDLTILRLDYIIRPFLHKMMKKNDKYLIVINKNRDSMKMKAILIAVERGYSVGVDYNVSIITAINAVHKERTIMIFPTISLENRFVSSEYFDDIIKIKELIRDYDDEEIIEKPTGRVINKEDYLLTKVNVITVDEPVFTSKLNIVKKGKVKK